MKEDNRASSFRQIRAIYYGMVSEVDAQLGRVFDGVKAAGAWGDTIVILTSDHAEMMGDHLMLGKGGFFDGSYHLPLIIRDPRRLASAGGTVDAFTCPYHGWRWEIDGTLTFALDPEDFPEGDPCGKLTLDEVKTEVFAVGLVLYELFTGRRASAGPRNHYMPGRRPCSGSSAPLGRGDVVTSP